MNARDVFYVIRNTENLLSDGVGSRLWRSGALAEELDSRKLKTKWVISNFDHYFKRHRSNEEVVERGGFTQNILKMLKTPGYGSNLSPMRIFDHFVFGCKLGAELFRDRRKIKVACCSYPTIASSFVTVVMSRFFGFKSLIDIRDKWPDVLIENKPCHIKLFLLACLMPYYFMRYITFKYADSLVAVNHDFLIWGQSIGGRTTLLHDRVIHIGFDAPEISSLENEEYPAYWLDPDEYAIKICFGGTIGRMFNFTTIASAVKILEKRRVKYKLMIFGDGDSFEAVKGLFSFTQNVLLVGRVRSDHLFYALSRADLLLAPYVDSSNFNNHIPNKISEYLAAGKPILTSINGYAGEMLEANDAGAVYRSPEELVALIVSYAHGDMERYAENAKVLYEREFRLGSITKMYASYIEQL